MKLALTAVLISDFDFSLHINYGYFSIVIIFFHWLDPTERLPRFRKINNNLKNIPGLHSHRGDIVNCETERILTERNRAHTESKNLPAVRCKSQSHHANKTSASKASQSLKCLNNHRNKIKTQSASTEKIFQCDPRDDHLEEFLLYGWFEAFDVLAYTLSSFSSLDC